MATVSFSAIPAEIHISIARHCENNDLINLCLVSKGMHRTYLPVLYCRVDLQLDRSSSELIDLQISGAILKRQQQFVNTLLSHPDYGMHVRIFKGTLSTLNFNVNDGLEEATALVGDLWRAMQLLTLVQSVHIASNIFGISMTVPNLFHSATSVRLVGDMEYGLARSVLNAINPATLEHLCLDMVQERGMMAPGHRGEDGRIIARGVMSGLLTTLTGRCTAIRTLILRRVGQCRLHMGWHKAADEASYVEWASFIRSVQGTLEKFTFEQVVLKSRPIFGFMDERFQRLVRPAIVSGNWPCLTNIEIRGVRGKAALTLELVAVLGDNSKIVVEEEAPYFQQHWQ